MLLPNDSLALDHLQRVRVPENPAHRVSRPLGTGSVGDSVGEG